MDWLNSDRIAPYSYQCGYCGNRVGSNLGYCTPLTKGQGIYICPLCSRPSYIIHNVVQFPGVPFGREIPHLPQGINSLYEEARGCCSISAYTAAVLCCRKLLLNVAVDKGAQPNQRFIEYVNHLVNNHHVPPSAQAWVDKIRDKGNEATHEIVPMEKADAENIISFVEMLLALIYDYPNR